MRLLFSTFYILNLKKTGPKPRQLRTTINVGPKVQRRQRVRRRLVATRQRRALARVVAGPVQRRPMRALDLAAVAGQADRHPKPVRRLAGLEPVAGPVVADRPKPGHQRGPLPVVARVADRRSLARQVAPGRGLDQLCRVRYR